MNQENKAIRFRVALFDSDTQPYTVTADNTLQEDVCQCDPRFIEWLTDWQEVIILSAPDSAPIPATSSA